jgi:hypothetical protein
VQSDVWEFSECSCERRAVVVDVGEGSHEEKNLAASRHVLKSREKIILTKSYYKLLHYYRREYCHSESRSFSS